MPGEKDRTTFKCIYCGKLHSRLVDRCPQTREAFSPAHKFEGATLSDRYHLKRIIGEGGMGIVYEGAHEKLGIKIAVKFLRADLNFSDETLHRFENEAKVAASVGHKNIVQIMDMGVHRSVPYFVMEFLEGKPLDGIIDREGTLSITQSVDIAIQILEGLNAVHLKGVIHRDLKDENIFLVPQPGAGDLVKILDFGICRLQPHSPLVMSATKTGAVFGTPCYMSPEQAEGRRDIDPRTDIYSVGAILYKMLTGRTPFVGENYNTIIASIISRDPTPPRKLNMEIPRDLEEVILMALHRNRDERFLDTVEFIERLEPFSSVPVRRDKRISALTKTRERKEPIPADIWEKDLPVPVVMEDGAATVEKRVPDSVLDRERQMAGLADVEVPAAKKKAFSWDGTMQRAKGILTGKEFVWLMPVGIALSLIAIVFAAAVILTSLNVNRIAGGIERSGKKAEPAVAKAPADGVVTKVEESSIEVIPPEVVTMSFNGIPPGARISVDGQPVEDPVRVDVRQGPYHVLVEADGFEPFEADLPVKSDTAVQVNMTPISKKDRKKGGQTDVASPPIDKKYPGKKHRKK
ncbi:MAG: serine/threonine-protein kinase [Pseudomonadota bacterium]